MMMTNLGFTARYAGFFVKWHDGAGNMGYKEFGTVEEVERFLGANHLEVTGDDLLDYSYHEHADGVWVGVHAVTTAEVDAGWQGDGWYSVEWSDGPGDFEPTWFESRRNVAEELVGAGYFATETHLPVIVYHGDGEEPA